jgi:hypothetical protein
MRAIGWMVNRTATLLASDNLGVSCERTVLTIWRCVTWSTLVNRTSTDSTGCETFRLL